MFFCAPLSSLLLFLLLLIIQRKRFVTAMIINLTKIAKTRASGSLPVCVKGVVWEKSTKKKLTVSVRHAFNRRVPKSLTKRQLAALLALHSGVSALQNNFRRKRIANQTKLYDNDICPFTLERPCPPVFIRTNGSGYRRAYTMDMLVDYFLLTGKCVDPVDKEIFNQNDLVRLDKELQLHGIHRDSVAVITTQERQDAYRSERENAEQISILVDQVQEDMSHICEVVSVNGVMITQADFGCFHSFRRHVAILYNKDNRRCETEVASTVTKVNDREYSECLHDAQEVAYVIGFVRDTLSHAQQGIILVDQMDEPFVEQEDSLILFDYSDTIGPIISSLNENLRRLTQMYASTQPVVSYTYTL